MKKYDNKSDFPKRKIDTSKKDWWKELLEDLPEVSVFVINGQVIITDKDYIVLGA